MRRAFNGLRNGAPGPVVLELTTDACDQEVPTDAQTYRPPKMARQQPATS